MEDLSYVKPTNPVKELIDDVNFERIPKRFSFSLDEKSVDAIQVYLRMKPDGDISNEGFLSVVEEEESSTSLILKKKTSFSKFSFTYIFKPSATQEEVFLKSTEAKLQEFFNGRSAFLFTYGTSSSGKTFTIHGKKNNPGLIPRIIATIFATLDNSIDDSFCYCPERSVTVVELSESEMFERSLLKERIIGWSKSLIQPYFSSKGDGIISFEELKLLMFKAKKLEVYDKDKSAFSIWCSFAEIYNEKIYDLLDEPKDMRSPLSLSMDRDKQVFIKGLKHIHVTTLEEAYLLYFFGCYNRSVNSTALNEKSSRSHSIFTIKILGRKKEAKNQFFISSSFSVCDLAGTERFSKTKNFGNRMKESRNINTSFLVLNRCLKIIRENQLREVDYVVPFRESKLTQIMGTSFTAGDTNLLMIVTVAQSPNLMDETEASLKSSAIATEIKAIIPSSVRKKKNMRFSTTFSHLDPGCGINWNDIVTSHKQVVSTSCQNGSSKFKDELEIERKRRQAAEKKLAEVEKIHKEEIEKLIEMNKELEKNKNLEASGAVQECSVLRQQMEELYDKYMDSKADILKWKKKLRLQKDELDQLQKDFEKLASTNEHLENMLDDAKEEVEELHEEVKALNEKLIEKDEALTLKEEKISMLELEISQLEENLEDNACERESYDRLVNALEDNLLKKKAEIEELNHQCDEKCREYEEKINLLEKKLALETTGESSKVKFENRNTPISIERSKSEEYLHLYSDSDDPSFVLSHNKCKTTVKKKKRRQVTESKSLYFDGPSNLSSNKSSGASARRKLYKQTSEEALDEPSDYLSSDTTQASPNTIFRTLRTGKRY